MKKVIVLFLIVAFLAIAAGCSQPAAPPEQPPATTAPAKVTPRATTMTYLPTTAAPLQEMTYSVTDNTVTITKKGYEPQQMKVKIGVDVRWVNDDDRIHRLVFLDDVKSPLLSPGQSYTRTFSKTGSVDYSDAMVTNLLGTITVE